MLSMSQTTLEYSADLVVATALSVGYLMAMAGMWWVRKSFGSVSSMGFLLFPILALNSLFYFAILHLGGMGGPWTEWFVWTSRLVHFMSLTLLAIVIVIGRNIKETREHGD